MKFSLLMCTINRKNEVEKFILSLISQTYKDFELIIVDQNKNNLIDDIIQRYSKYINILHIKLDKKGLSLARNVGLNYITGDIVAFPDDDCYYSKDTLEKVHNILRDKTYIDVLIIKVENFEKKRWEKVYCKYVNRFELLRLVTSINIFAKKNVIREVGNFDENIGIGSNFIFLSGEETDYFLRALNKGFKIYYIPNIVVYHPYIFENMSKAEVINKNFYYNCGLGYILKKNKYPLWFIFYLCIVRPFGGILISIFKLDFFKARFYFMSFIGRNLGWLMYCLCIVKK